MGYKERKHFNVKSTLTTYQHVSGTQARAACNLQDTSLGIMRLAATLTCLRHYPWMQAQESTQLSQVKQLYTAKDTEMRYWKVGTCQIKLLDKSVQYTYSLAEPHRSIKAMV